jgi:hypothetical protein
MQILTEAILLTGMMLILVAASFGLVFILAIAAAPVERELSKVIWSARERKGKSARKPAYIDYSKRSAP